VHAPRLHQFLEAIPTNESITPSIEGTELAGQILGTLSVALNPHRLVEVLSNALGIGGLTDKDP